MIIFDLDGTLANCEHRRHFVDPKKNPLFNRREYGNLEEYIKNLFIPVEYILIETTPEDIMKNNYKVFKPDWDAFEEACDKDTPNRPICEIFVALAYEPYNRDIQIWSGRTEKVREKTIKWIEKAIPEFENAKYIERILKMRPIGNTEPDDELKEKWLDEILAKGKKIEMVFDDRQKVVDMWRRRGITCLQVAEGDF